MFTSRWTLCALVLLANTMFAADFGDIPANLTLPAGTSVRRNAGNTAFEAFTSLGNNATITLFSSGDSDDVVAHPYTSNNTGIKVLDANGVEVWRLWASDPNSANFNSYNLYLGAKAGFTQPTNNTNAGYYNLGIGSEALFSITTGHDNIAVGNFTLWANATGNNNTAVGNGALGTATGSYNDAHGLNALANLTSGTGNVGFGNFTLYGVTTGSSNASLGDGSGAAITTGSNNVAIGSQSRNAPADAYSNAITIGATTAAPASNTAVIGNSSVTDVYFGSTSGNAILHGKGVVPTGGTTGQVLSKNSNTNFDIGWSAGGGTNAFGTIAVSGQSDVVADAAPDTLTLVAGSNITLTTNASTDTVTIAAAGGGAGTPGGSNTHVQYNDGGAFGGDSGMTWDKTAKTFTVTNTASGTVYASHTISNGTSGGQLAITGTSYTPFQSLGANQAFVVGDGSNGLFLTGYSGPIKLAGSANWNEQARFYYPVGWVVNSGLLYTWSSTGSPTSPDTAFGRNAAGIVEINNGTAGQYRDLYARNISLQSSGVITGSGSVPTGGTTSQVLTKNSNTNYDVGWAAAGGGAPTAPETLTLDDANNTIPSTLLTLHHTTSATPSAGMGSRLLFQQESTGGTGRDVAAITGVWDEPTDGIRKGYLLFSTGNSGALSSRWRIYDSGALTTQSTDPGASVVDVATGYRINGASPTSGRFMQGQGLGYMIYSPWALPLDAGSAGKILQSSSGTVSVWSTATWPTTGGTTSGMVQYNGTNYVVSTPSWPTAAGTAGYTMRSDGTNFASYPQDMLNSSTADDTSFSTSDRYVAGSSVVVAAGDFKAKGQYHCVFDMVKSAGTGGIVITARVGTTGSTSDTTATITFTFGAGTSIADTGTFEVFVNWRSVGSGTSAVISGMCRAQKNAASTTGLWNNTGTDLVIVGTTSSGFNSSAVTTIGVSFNGGTAFAGTNKVVQATLVQ